MDPYLSLRAVLALSTVSEGNTSVRTAVLALSTVSEGNTSVRTADVIHVRIVSDETRDIYMFVNFVALVNLISVFGCVTNVTNIIVFIKQGFSNTMNISLLGLAISDLLSLVALLWYVLCLNPLFERSGVPMVPPEMQHLTGGVPHICFVRITGWITVFITAERCLCITLPLKIKQIVTPKRTVVIVSIIYITMMFSFFPEYATAYIDWKFVAERNRTMLGLVFTHNRKSMEGVVFIMYSFLGTLSFIAVIIFTVVLIVSLKRKSTWRKKASADRDSTVTNRDRKAVTMVVLLAAIVIVCYIPGIAVSMVVFFVPEFSIIGTYVNIFFVAWSFAFVFEATNASVNIFLYYSMSTKYRQTFRQLFFNEKNITGDAVMITSKNTPMTD